MELDANLVFLSLGAEPLPLRARSELGAAGASAAGLSLRLCNQGQNTNVLTVSLHPGSEELPGHVTGQAITHVLVSPASPSDIKRIVY